jgi:rhamnose transport system permease protein
MKEKPWIPAILLVASFLVAGKVIPHFWDLAYLLDTSTIYIEIGLLALGMTLVIISGNIDLSVGSNLVLTACLTARLAESNPSPIVVVPFACLCGSTLGLLNGLLVARLKVPSFLVTLGTMATFRGIAQAMLGANSVKFVRNLTGIDQSYFLGVPWPLLLMVLAATAFGLLLHRTVLGRWIYALGTSEKASFFSGVPIDRVKVIVFGIAGVVAGIGALLLDSRLGVARHDLVKGIELDAITVAVLGGAAIRGGKGSILGTCLAFLLVMVVKMAMGVANVKAEYQLTAIGAILIFAVLIDEMSRQWKLPVKRSTA